MVSPTIPNTSTSGTVGVPSPLSVACESDDTTFTPLPGDARQQVSLYNIAVEMRQNLTLIAQALSLAPDPGSGRLRVLLDSVNSNSGNVPVNIAGQTQPITIGFISTTNQSGNKPDTLVFDAMQNAWANSVYPCIARS